MNVRIEEVGPEALETWAKISIAFRVESELRVEVLDGGLGGLRLVETPVAEPYVKNYDAYRTERPIRWRRWDLSNWLFVQAFVDGRVEPVGAAAVACRSPKVWMLEGREDLACLWDIRVHPKHRRKGVGSRLFRYAIAWAAARGCRQFKVETQNVNVAACRFYAAQGCHLASIDRYGYSGDPRIAHEAMLIWRLDL